MRKGKRLKGKGKEGIKGRGKNLIAESLS